MSDENAAVYAEDGAEGIRRIYLNQPEKKNAISAAMMEMLTAELLRADADDAIRVIVISGVAGNFSSGGDLNQGSAHGAGPEGARKTLQRYEQALRTIRRISTPVIAMVDGYAVGGAFALTLASDLVYASERALFVPAFCQIGIIPEMGIMKYLPELVGPQRAKEILFLGGKFDAARMQGLGLVNAVFPADELEAETLALAARLAQMPDASIQITKGIMNSIADSNLDALLETETTASPFCTTTTAYAKTMEKFKK
jgi:2-(1,2-epoxy-1,2-dihydrophenyl)acetyl-CoA isomerase